MYKKALSLTALACLVSLSNATLATGLPEAVETKREMIVTSHPLATDVGARILKRGGTAVDAMVAAQAVLGLVEPQSSGLGGGAFVVLYDAHNRELKTFDARETAPAAATEDRFAFLDFGLAWQSGLSVGVPGVPRLLEELHDEYGYLPLKKVLRPARRLATNGFELDQRTSDQVAFLLSLNPSCEIRVFFRDPTSFEYFANPDCTAKPAGTLIQNPEYAETLRVLAKEGADGFYEGEIAQNIVTAVQTDLVIPGDLTLEDLENYVVIEREPVCGEYKEHAICGMGAPSSGGLAVGQMLGILDNFSIEGEPLDVDNVHLFTQSGRLAFADRNLYVADPDFVTIPSKGMLDEHYLANRALLITDTDLGVVEAGVPPGTFDPFSPDSRAKNTGTSHISIVDRYGNALSMTTSIESPFGNGVMVNGFLLNNQLTDFSFQATDANGLPIANRVEGGKRPRSSMSPTIVFDPNHRVKMVTGSPGGSGIIGYTAQSIFNVLGFGLDPQQAINIPHYMNKNGVTEIELPITGVTLDYDPAALAQALKEKGHSDPNVPVEQRIVLINAQTSGLGTIVIERNKRGKRVKKLVGGADARRGGKVGGK
ncbi:gamma-glutamyltransferase [Alteromonas macleodii]|uniref:Glutathione hydrolase proenzyme n=1 Tax=Alteromonas macleodii TaxID=28108 RepID=A0AB36FQN7_ALTMA|nr:gamma-glutamyltransferase [Alteromonas macleodii]OES24160.1 gamma-glutamyltransferase [Alteromonas macleodii]OES24794.1 gamma-glutamyltransferase [Alteromonas macleodii]OES25072.1 gamma-glutamyltransferase [Alteromonas macleodii]OES39115.1 gamma-glutamyltransferase [Alteromonas macleodii]